MKIELKSIKFSEHLSEETNAFTANLYVDGKKIGYCRNDGHGGNTNVQPFGKDERVIFLKAEAYCKTLPPHTYKFGGETKSIDCDLEMVVDNLFEEWLKEKDVKKLEQKMKNHLMWGIPNGNSYNSVKIRKPLSDVSPIKLQQELDKWKKEFKEGEVYLNTNLKEFKL